MIHVLYILLNLHIIHVYKKQKKFKLKPWITSGEKMFLKNLDRLNMKAKRDRINYKLIHFYKT